MDAATDTMSLTLAIAVIVLLALVGIWDIWAAFGPSEGRTVSQILYGWGQQFPPLVLGVGLLLGHLFWPVGPHK
jgi:hypothetical protein